VEIRANHCSVTVKSAPYDSTFPALAPPDGPNENRDCGWVKLGNVEQRTGHSMLILA